ncbi:hypothetical protein PV325_002336 [Microctonus aethiopoides]|nr:hypothetical protein PV325_002336 [Microctonus aethiopoides]
MRLQKQVRDSKGICHRDIICEIENGDDENSIKREQEGNIVEAEMKAGLLIGPSLEEITSRLVIISELKYNNGPSTRCAEGKTRTENKRDDEYRWQASGNSDDDDDDDDHHHHHHQRSIN